MIGHRYIDIHNNTLYIKYITIYKIHNNYIIHKYIHFLNHLFFNTDRTPSVQLGATSPIPNVPDHQKHFMEQTKIKKIIHSKIVS